jgi:threonine/homoserine/homoserine lactone efflux protein
VPSPSTLSLFCLAAVAVLVVPGPAVLYITSRSAAQGRRAGLVSVLGVHAGTLVHVRAAVVGLSAVLVASAVAFTGVKVVGGLYLVWLGVRTIRSGLVTTTSRRSAPQPLGRLWAQGFVVNVLNPKTAVFFLAFLPQFVRPHVGPVWSQTLVLGLLFVALGMVSDASYALAGARVGRWLARRPRAQRRGHVVEGSMLIGLGVTTLAVPSTRS